MAQLTHNHIKSPYFCNFWISRFAFCSGSFLCKMFSLVPGPEHAHFVQEIGKGMIGMQSRWRNPHAALSNHHLFGIFGFPGLHFWISTFILIPSHRQLLACLVKSGDYLHRYLRLVRSWNYFTDICWYVQSRCVLRGLILWSASEELALCHLLCLA